MHEEPRENSKLEVTMRKLEARNPKLETISNDKIGKHQIRNPKFETNSKIKKYNVPNTISQIEFWKFEFGVHSILVFVSDFDIRILDLTF